MRLRLLLSPICAVLLGSCAYQGTIVEKEATPLPFTHSYGLDASYAFFLRDTTGAVRRQIVTAEVFHDYAIGEYFNDLEPRRMSDGKSFDGKTVMTAMISKVSKTRNVATTRKPQQKQQIAKSKKATKSNVKIAKKPRPALKKQQRARVAKTTAQPRKALPTAQRVELPPQILRARPVWDGELAHVSVARCR